ncbi:hypothetical protein VTN96DRAFT_8776 [Rasamsonia emersonii]
MQIRKDSTYGNGIHLKTDHRFIRQSRWAGFSLSYQQLSTSEPREPVQPCLPLATPIYLLDRNRSDWISTNISRMFMSRGYPQDISNRPRWGADFVSS